MNARALWTPELAFSYGIRPWEVGRLRPVELRAIRQHHETLMAEQEG